jgi:hypothetical protein
MLKVVALDGAVFHGATAHDVVRQMKTTDWNAPERKGEYMGGRVAATGNRYRPDRSHRQSKVPSSRTSNRSVLSRLARLMPRLPAQRAPVVHILRPLRRSNMYAMIQLFDGTKYVSEFSKLRGLGGYADRVLSGNKAFNIWKIVSRTHPHNNEPCLVRTRTQLNGRRHSLDAAGAAVAVGNANPDCRALPCRFRTGAQHREG